MTREKIGKSSYEHQNGSHRTEPEVVPLAKRRQFSGAYKERILSEADGCSQPGEIGALLRREGLYSSYLTSWRRERDREARLATQKRGRKGRSEAEKELVRLQAENEQLRTQLAQAEIIIDVQKKVSQLFGLSSVETKQAGNK